MIQEWFDRTVPIQYVSIGFTLGIVCVLGLGLMIAYIGVWLAKFGDMISFSFIVVSLLTLTISSVYVFCAALVNLDTYLGIEYREQKFSSDS